MFVAALLSSLALLAGACSSSKKQSTVSAPAAANSKVKPVAMPDFQPAPWAAPPDPMARAQQAGLVPEPAEELQYHVHAHLDVFVNGQVEPVPAGIGIDITNPGVHSGGSGLNTSYGGISVPCNQPCISPLHTHDWSGILHTESKTPTPNTLGEFFVEWGVRLDANCVGGYCKPADSVLIFTDGHPFTGDPTTIGLFNRREIAIVIGTPPKKIPSSVPF